MVRKIFFLSPKHSHNVGLLLLGILTLSNLLMVVPSLKMAGIRQRMANAEVTVSIDTTKRASPSGFFSGMSNVDTSLFYPWSNNNEMAVNEAKSLIKHSLSFINQYIMSWGADDPWRDPTQAEPSNWSTLDRKLQIAHDTGATPVITLNEAPWWMKGQLQPDGTTKLLTSADDFADIAYTSRILDNKMNSWLHLVQRVAERYMVAPYNVRYFQVWNELKGYYDPITNNWDMSNSAGDPGGPNAKHGYTYMYNEVYRTLKKVATAKGIDPATIQVGGPYLVMNTWSNAAIESNPSDFTKAYGNYDQRDLDALKYWLRNKVGAEFITVAGDNSNQDGINIADPFTASEKFADVVTWIRSLNKKWYPEAATLPIWWAEWYASPYTFGVNDNYNNAVKSYALVKLLKAGGAVAFSWGGIGEGTASGGIWTTSPAGGVEPLPWYYSLKALRDKFPPGTRLYKTTVSSPGSIEALASATTIMLINKTTSGITITLNGNVVFLPPYQVRVLSG